MEVAGVKTVRGRIARSGRAGCWIGTAAWAALSLAAAIDASAAPFEESIVAGPGVAVASEPESVLMPRPATAGVSTMAGGVPVHDGMVMMQNADGSWVVDGSNQVAWDHDGYGECPETGYRPVDGILNRCLGDACPRWVVQADALMLWRGMVPSRPLFVGEPNPPDPTVPYLNLDQIYAPVTIGPRLALLLNIDCCYALEANYFYLDGFNGTGSIPNDGTPYAMNNLAGNNFGSITDAQALTSGKIQSFELNWRRWNGRSLTWLAGFRWVEWNEGLNITSNYSDPGPPVVEGTDNILVNTKNDLYGGQVGVDAILLTLFNRVRFNGIAKAGIYGNWNAQSTLTASGDNIGPAQTFAFSSTPLSFMGEVGVNGTLRLTRNWSARAGYNFFWMTGLATAGPQLDAVDTSGTVVSTMNTNGTVFLNGLNVGTEFIW